ncbi:MAG TPA: hypothetical protein VKF42_05500 [Chitinivibrionales bacterium]|jgi:hypothetical protein|nr:hypothetical protein [Chitinivibrionales bacterium]
MFFWKHKIISLLIIAGLAYFFVNPPHKFGIATTNFVVFNRVPITGLDLFIDFEGAVKPFMSLGGADERREWMKSILETPPEEDMLVIVGTGFGTSSFHLSDSLVMLLNIRNIRSSQVPSGQAVQQYNAALDQKKKVALLLELKK